MGDVPTQDQRNASALRWAADIVQDWADRLRKAGTVSVDHVLGWEAASDKLEEMADEFEGGTDQEGIPNMSNEGDDGSRDPRRAGRPDRPGRTRNVSAPSTDWAVRWRIALRQARLRYRALKRRWGLLDPDSRPLHVAYSRRRKRGRR